MKKKVILAGIVLLLAASVCVIAVGIRKNRESNPVRIDDKNSFFEDFTVQDDVVNIKCKLFLQNVSGQDKKFYIRAKSPEDVGVLLSDENLMVREMGAEKLFECKAGERIAVDVTFVGQYGGTEQKADREMPDEIALVYTEGISTESSDETQSNRTKPWYGAYQSILNDWTVIGQYGSGEIGYIKQYFGKDYQFDSYWLSDIDGDGTPELFLHAEHMNDLTAVFTYSGNELIYLMVDAIYGINKEKAEVVINGHWHGAGGSGINEWHVYRIENDEAVYVWMFDKYHETRYEIWDVENWTFYEVQETGNQYIELYDAHVEGCVLASSYQQYDLDDLSGLDFIQ